MTKPLKISEQAAVQMPMKTVASLIKYPRGELGQSSGEAELFMLVEHLAGLLEDIDSEVKSMRNNAVNIEFLQERTKKLTEDVEKLIRNGNGH